MSIKTIDRETTDHHSGLERTIDSGAHRLVLDILQATQYSTPIPSSVRELTTNALDAQREKEMAIAILTGSKKPEDFYIRREGEQYRDSNWDPSYYSLAHLDTTTDGVELVYHERNGTGFCDTFSVTDHGVGIGKGRLEGVFRLGFSTKRNTQHNFGAYGLGAKVALSTGVPMYSVRTVYNGRLVTADCYPYKTVFTVPRFNMVTGQENPSMTLSDGTILHYEEVSELNGTTVSFNVKSHNREAFRRAVREQLLYIEGVSFTVVSDRGTEHVEVGAEVVYNSDCLILGDSSIFSTPHIVVVKSPGDMVGIVYGQIDFRELELQQLYGCAGLKCPIRQSYRDEDGKEIVLQEGVSVTPSRERVVWDDSTKAFIQSLLLKAREEAERLLEDKLSYAPNFTAWLMAAAESFGSKDLFAGTSVLGRMSRLVPKENLVPKCPFLPGLKYGGGRDMLGTLTMETLHINDKGHPSLITMNSGDLTSEHRIFLRAGRASPRLNAYLFRLYGTKVCVFREFADSLVEVWEGLDKHRNRAADIMEHLVKDGALNYDTFEIPEDFEFKDPEEPVVEEERPAELTPEERRALNQAFVGFAFGYSDEYSPKLTQYKIEPTIAAIENAAEPVYWFYPQERSLAEVLAISIGMFQPKLDANRSYSFRKANSSIPIHCTFIGPAENHYLKGVRPEDKECINLVQFSQETIQKIGNARNLKHMSALWGTVRNNVLEVHPWLRKLYTLEALRNTQTFSDVFKESSLEDLIAGLKKVSNVVEVPAEVTDSLYVLKDYIILAEGYFTCSRLSDMLRVLEEQNALFASVTGGDHVLPLAPTEDTHVQEMRRISWARFTRTDVQRVLVRELDLNHLLPQVIEFLEPYLPLERAIGYGQRDTKFYDALRTYLGAVDRLTWKWEISFPQPKPNVDI